MEYITASEAAQKWQVHVRIVQTYCLKGRIPGSKKMSRVWMIPMDAQRPRDPRDKGKTKLEQKALVFFVGACSLLSGHADESVAALSNLEERTQQVYELAYYRGDFDMASQGSQQITKKSSLYSTALLFSAIAHLSLGNHIAFEVCENELMELCRGKSDWDHLVVHIKFLKAILDLSMYACHSLPEWLINGELSCLPYQARLYGFQHYVKYLHFQGEFDKMLTVADTALTFCHIEGRYTIPEIYLLLYSALGNLKGERIQLAKSKVQEAMRLALPDGIIMPFVENLTTLRGLIETCMKEEYPQYLDEVIEKWKMIFPQWVKVHNERLKKDITLILTRQEYQISLYAADKLTNKDISIRSGLSTESIKKHFNVIYQKLGVSNRSELAQYIL